MADGNKIRLTVSFVAFIDWIFVVFGRSLAVGSITYVLVISLCLIGRLVFLSFDQRRMEALLMLLSPFLIDRTNTVGIRSVIAFGDMTHVFDPSFSFTERIPFGFDPAKAVKDMTHSFVSHFFDFSFFVFVWSLIDRCFFIPFSFFIIDETLNRSVNGQEARFIHPFPISHWSNVCHIKSPIVWHCLLAAVMSQDFPSNSAVFCRNSFHRIFLVQTHFFFFLSLMSFR